MGAQADSNDEYAPTLLEAFTLLEQRQRSGGAAMGAQADEEDEYTPDADAELGLAGILRRLPEKLGALETEPRAENVPEAVRRKRDADRREAAGRRGACRLRRVHVCDGPVSRRGEPTVSPRWEPTPCALWRVGGSWLLGLGGYA